MRAILSCMALAVSALLYLLHVVAGLTTLAAGAGLGGAALVGALLVVGMRRSGRDHLPVADQITLARAILACGAVALVANGFGAPGAADTGAATRSVATIALGTLATTAIVLDGLDGLVARRLETVSDFGARFDQEVDAFLILVLSIQVAATLGWWVLLIGAARYVFLLAGLRYSWLRATPPANYWAKIVALVQGVVLTVACLHVVPDAVAVLLAAVALALLAESFARSCWELWRAHRPTVHRPAAPRGITEGVRSG